MTYRPEKLTEDNVAGNGPMSDKKTLLIWIPIWTLFYIVLPMFLFLQFID